VIQQVQDNKDLKENIKSVQEEISVAVLKKLIEEKIVKNCKSQKRRKNTTKGDKENTAVIPTQLIDE
jgi:hypothetical protein